MLLSFGHLVLSVYVAGFVATGAISLINRKSELRLATAFFAHVLWPASIAFALYVAVKQADE